MHVLPRRSSLYGESYITIRLFTLTSMWEQRETGSVKQGVNDVDRFMPSAGWSVQVVLPSTHPSGSSPRSEIGQNPDAGMAVVALNGKVPIQYFHCH